MTSRSAANPATDTDPRDPKVGPISDDPIIAEANLPASEPGRTATGRIIDAAFVAEPDTDGTIVKVTATREGGSQDVWVDGFGNTTFVVGATIGVPAEVLKAATSLGVVTEPAAKPAAKAKE